MATESPLSWDELDKRAGATLLSTSGSHWPGLVVKRTISEPSIDMLPAPQDTHMVVVHNTAAVNLQWRDGKRVRNAFVPPGYVIVNPAGYVEGRAWDKRSEDVRLALRLDSAYFGPSRPALRPAIGVHDPLLAQLGRSLARTFEIGGPADPLYADALAHALGAHLVAHYSDRPTIKPDQAPDTLGWRQLEQVYDYIECNLHQALTVTDLATVAGISPTHFTRLFRQQTGEPPHHYVRNRRLDRAEGLIVGTQLPLAAIAIAAGFSDQSHLNRVMRAERGRTPGQLRESFDRRVDDGQRHRAVPKVWSEYPTT
jgi:AraC family transcriptional regulator